jgi:hypothetical protein
VVANLHAFGPVAVEPDETFPVPMTIADALGVGMSMRALALTGRMPPSTAVIYHRVGEQLVAAAKAEMKRRVDAALESGAKAKSAKCGCVETYPQLIRGAVAHGPGCAKAGAK